MKAKNIFLWILLLGRIVCVWGNKKFWDPEMAATTWCCESEDVSIPGMSKVPLKKISLWMGWGFGGVCLAFKLQTAVSWENWRTKGKDVSLAWLPCNFSKAVTWTN